MARPTHPHPHNRLPLPHIPLLFESHLSRHLPLIPAPTGSLRSPRLPNPLRQRRARFRFRGLLHHRAVLHARVRYAAHYQADCHLIRHQRSCETGTLSGTILYGHVLQHIRAVWTLGYEPDADLVLQYDGYVRGVPAQDARGGL